MSGPGVTLIYIATNCDKELWLKIMPSYPTGAIAPGMVPVCHGAKPWVGGGVHMDMVMELYGYAIPMKSVLLSRGLCSLIYIVDNGLVRNKQDRPFQFSVTELDIFILRIALPRLQKKKK